MRVFGTRKSRVGGISFWFHFCSSDNNDIFHIHLSHSPLSRVQTPLSAEGPVVWRPISANPGLNFYPCFFSLRSKAFFRKIFSILFGASNHLPWVPETSFARFLVSVKSLQWLAALGFGLRLTREINLSYPGYKSSNCGQKE